MKGDHDMISDESLKSNRDRFIEAENEFIMKDSDMEWISVNDRLPEYFERVLVYYRPKSSTLFVQIVSQRLEYMPVSKHVTDKNKFNLIGQVTHWMPLPEPPKS